MSVDWFCLMGFISSYALCTALIYETLWCFFRSPPDPINKRGMLCTWYLARVPYAHLSHTALSAVLSHLSFTMSNYEHPSYIPIPPLRSAMKHPSRPSTPSLGTNTPNSPLPPPRSPLPSVSPLPSPSPWNSTSSSFLSTAPATPNASQLGLSSASTLPSPPAPLVAAQGYTPKVSFDTLENPQASMFSYTLHVQSEGYARKRNTRVFLCAASPDESGNQALDFALEGLLQDGDELIVFRGVDTDEFGMFSRNRCLFVARSLMESLTI